MTDTRLHPNSVTSAQAAVLPVLSIAPAQVMRGAGILAQAGTAIARLGQRPLVVGGDRTLKVSKSFLYPALEQAGLSVTSASYGLDCSEVGLEGLRQAVQQHNADLVIGIGGGKALDAAKLLAHQCYLPIVTIPTSAATCAAWTALSNIYTEQGAFRYDVGLPHLPQSADSGL